MKSLRLEHDEREKFGFHITRLPVTTSGTKKNSRRSCLGSAILVGLRKSAIQIESGTDQCYMRERLWEIAEVFTRGTKFLSVQTQVISVA